MKNKLKQVGLIGLLVGATYLGFSKANAQQSETGFWIRQRPTFTDYGATARDYWATVVDNNERADQTRNEAAKAINEAREQEIRRQEKLNQIEEEKQEIARWTERVAKLKKERDPHGLENKIIFTANRWIDLNENGYIDWNEFQGVKNDFEEGENLKVIVHNTYTNAKEIRLKLYGPTGKIILNSNPKSKLASNDLFWAGSDSDDYFRIIFKNAGAGSYKAVIYFDEESVETHDFEIKRNSKSPMFLKQIISLDDKIIGLDQNTASGEKILHAKNPEKGDYQILVNRTFDKKQTSKDRTLANLNNQEVCYNVYYGVYLIPKAKN